MPAVDEVEEGMGRGRLVVALLHLAEAYVVNDKQLWCGPALQALGVGGVSEAGVSPPESWTRLITGITGDQGPTR